MEFDDATGQSVYNQVNTDEACRNLAIEESIFLTCFAPFDLNLFRGPKQELVWRNHKPLSPVYCRPVQFKYMKEIKEVFLAEFQSIKDNI